MQPDFLEVVYFCAGVVLPPHQPVAEAVVRDRELRRDLGRRGKPLEQVECATLRRPGFVEFVPLDTQRGQGGRYNCQIELRTAAFSSSTANGNNDPNASALSAFLAAAGEGE